jgi:hypothetical protein
VNKLTEIIEAYRAIDAAERHYREVLRKHLTSGAVQQVDVATALNRTREMIRRDAMTEEQREEIRRADAERKRQLRQPQTKGVQTPQS